MREQPVPVAALDDPAAIEDVHLVAESRHDPQVVGDHDERRTGVDDQLLEQREDLGLDGDVEGRGGLVSDQQPRLTRQRHRDQRPLPHPPAELVRVVLQASPRVGYADPLEQLLRLRHRLLARQAAMALHHLGDLDPDRHHRVQRRQRVLKDHRDVTTAAVSHLRCGELQEVGALVRRRPLDLIAARGQQAHDRQRRHRLPTAGLAHQAQRLAGVDVERDAVHGVEGRLAPPGERDAQVAH